MGLLRGPYVENPMPDSALVRWRTEISTVSWLEYGPAPSCSKTMTISEGTSDHAIKLFDLLPATTYCYRILLPYNEGANSVLAATGTFSTLRAPEQEQTEFLVFGNTGSGLESEQALAHAILRFSPDFALHTGNLFPSGTEDDADRLYFTPYKDVLAKMTVFIAPGENEYGDITAGRPGLNFFNANYRKAHQMTWSKGTPQYYSFRTANALFIVLDTNFAAGFEGAPKISPDSPQYIWLKNLLSKTVGVWKFVLMHNPAYANGTAGAYPALTQDLTPLFEKYGVNAVFQGKELTYERTLPVTAGAPAEKDGVVYITSGDAGRPHPPILEQAAGQLTAKQAPVPHFVRVAVSKNTAAIQAYGADGALLDETAITR
ncbi:MAG: metallophosphoesterase family protein [Elusimicrobia bacterium]|nr:metallophosphoesterase family protein [Elusimicrobiota bacterium]